MPLYVSLTNFTDQGIKNVRDTVRRAEDARGLIERHGGQLRLLLWTLGDYDQSRWSSSPTTRPLPPCCCSLAPLATSGPPP
jgi:uncharacterized protein with GYD domain